LQDFYDGIQSPNKKILWLEDAGHMMFADSQEEHFEAFSYFLQSSCDAK
jgi:esterase/lipase